MRESFNPTINLQPTYYKGAAFGKALTAILPISRGPYAGHDLLYVVDDLCGRETVVRAKMDGEWLSESEPVRRGEGIAKAQEMIAEQSRKDCNAVTGGGKYSCE